MKRLFLNIQNTHPVFAGKGACPDEDCGGLWGYEAMKEAGDVNDATYFDVEEVNDLLSDMPYDGYGKIFN